MKKIVFILSRTTARIIVSVVLLSVVASSCVQDLLDQQPTTELGSAAYWSSQDDAQTAIMGVYAFVRNGFNCDFLWDGHCEYVYYRTIATDDAAYWSENHPYRPDPIVGDDHYSMYRHLYGGVNRCNYVIENVQKMLSNTQAADQVAFLERIIGEARFMRGLCYFRMICMWGDVPYIGNVINDVSEVDNISRTPIREIKEHIMDDFTYAAQKMPDRPTNVGRFAKPAAIGFRGKLQLFWACWNKFGWPELNGFVPSATEAQAAYIAAAADFKEVIENPAYGLDLFRGGEPGEWGEMGKADVLPNYYYLFIPRTGNGASENIVAFAQGGVGTGQSERFLRYFGSRSHEQGLTQMIPYYELISRYQSTITGDFCEPMILMNPNTDPDARTTPNSAVNPESYANRDYRMKATVMWDYEVSMGLSNYVATGWCPFIYGTWNAPVEINGEWYTSYNSNSGNSCGIAFRKFVPNYPGYTREEGDYGWPLMRLADVFLMYAEATNEAYGPLPDAIALVNRIRHRGNLPPLASSKTDTKEHFFDAIEQERIIELYSEGHRSFDLRRWRALERVWGPPNSPRVTLYSTWGEEKYNWFNNLSELAYQRRYIFMIPQRERERNPNLTQNTPWL